MIYVRYGSKYAFTENLRQYQGKHIGCGLNNEQN